MTVAATPRHERRKGAPGRPDPDTRQRVIDGAVDCILERGFYRASSNAVAEQVGLSWGVIQYYFGTRESLMLAVLEDGTRRLVETVSTADITGDTLIERIEQYFLTLEQYYGDRRYLAFIQVLLNLSHDPRTSAQTLETMTRISKVVDVELDRLTTKLFAGVPIRQRRLRSLVFHVLRGLALSEVMLGTLPFDSSRPTRELKAQRRLVARALSLLIEDEIGDDRRDGVVDT
jgi:AcrR family transcriptional regulator